MGEKCLKQYHIHHECCLTTNIITLSQFSNFPKLRLKYHLPRLQSPVWGGGYQIPIVGKIFFSSIKPEKLSAKVCAKKALY